MDRRIIKKKARELIRGNLWNLIWPVLVIGIVSAIISAVFGTSVISFNIKSIDDLKELSNIKITYSPLYFISSLIISFLYVAYYKYVLDFIKTGEFDENFYVDVIKKRWLCIICLTILCELIISIGFICLIIPGIILMLGFSMIPYLVVDTNLGTIDILKKSWNMMNGYKWDYFVFGLSFIGWILLTPLTFFLLLIWLGPYMTVAQALYYVELKKKKK